MNAFTTGQSRRLLASVAVAAALVAGCSSDGTKPKPIRADDYLSAEPGKPLSTDSDVVLSDAYQIPSLSDQVAAQPLGEDVDIKPPALVLNIPEGSRPVAGRGAVLAFGVVGSGTDTVELPELQQRLWRALADFSKQPQLQQLSADAEQGQMLLQFNEMAQAKGLGGAIGRKADKGSQQFAVSLAPATEAGGFQTGWQVGVQLVGTTLPEDPKLAADELSFEQLPASERRRMEIALLNRFSGFYQTLAEDLRDARIALAGRIDLTLGENNSQMPAFIADAGFDLVWKRLPQALRGMNFDIHDRNRALGTYFVEYDPPLMKNVGLFGRQETTDETDLRQVDYEVQLGVIGEMGEHTAITFHTDGGKPLSRDELASFYVRFAELMRDSQAR